MGNPKLLFALLIASVTVSAALKCHINDFSSGGNRNNLVVIETDSRDHLCIRMTYHCAAYEERPIVCTAEDVTASRNTTIVFPYLRSDYTELLEDTYCSSDPNVRLVAPQLFDIASCDTDLCNDFDSNMSIPTCDKPVDPSDDGRGLESIASEASGAADFYCNVATWADDSSITQSTDRAILYPPRDSYCISAHITEKQTGKAVWRAAYMGSSELKKRGENSVCKDNVFEDDDAIFRSVRICQWSGCNDGNTGDLVTCPGATQAAAGEATTRLDGRGLLQLLDRNAARAKDDARRVLRVLQSITADTSGALAVANATVTTSAPSPSDQAPSTAAGTPSPSVSVSSSTPSPPVQPAQGPSPVPVTRPPVSAAVSAAQISGIFWVPALIAVVALTSNA